MVKFTVELTRKRNKQKERKREKERTKEENQRTAEMNIDNESYYHVNC